MQTFKKSCENRNVLMEHYENKNFISSDMQRSWKDVMDLSSFRGGILVRWNFLESRSAVVLGVVNIRVYMKHCNALLSTGKMLRKPKIPIISKMKLQIKSGKKKRDAPIYFRHFGKKHMSSKCLPRYMENPFQKNPKKGAKSVSNSSGS